MHTRSILPFWVACLPLAVSSTAFAAGILSPNDFIIGIDGNRNNFGNTNTGGEGPLSAFDGNDGSKWLSFGRSWTGLIVTPSVGSSVVQSLSFTTGGDAPERDPVSFLLYGTNNPIVSVDNTDGLSDGWSFIANGLTGFAPATQAATARNTTAPTVNITNATAYSSYKVIFTQLRKATASAFDPITLANAANPNSVQISEVRMFNAGNVDVALSPSLAVAIDQTDSFSPPTERPLEAIDGLKSASSKYLNFGREGAGLIITPAVGSSTVRGLQLTTGNDVPGRDPASYELYGTNSAISSIEDSAGNSEPWTLISSGNLALPDLRNTEGGIVGFGNETAYTSYKIVFPDNKLDGAGVDSIQFSELELFNTPEPASAVIISLTGGALLLRRRRRS